ncbi:MAG: hypothetical protein GXP35_16530 [Actinobacteria bacterium]|nr:hypothetical protein [Actinomycetota bacterium]
MSSHRATTTAVVVERPELTNRYGQFGPGAVIEREGEDLQHRLDTRAAVVEVTVADVEQRAKSWSPPMVADGGTDDVDR